MDPSFLVIVVIALGAMWLLSNRTRKQQRAAVDFRSNLTVGQEVMTGSGLFGTVVDVEDDIITLESTPGTQTRWLRAAIAKLVEPPVAAEEPEDDEIEDESDDEYVEDEAYADDEPIDVPDDLSSLPPQRKDGPSLRKDGEPEPK